MDDATFDVIARLLGRAASRRQGLRGALAAGAALVTGSAVAAAAPEDERCLQNGQRCGKKSGNNGGPCRRCCSRYWTTGKKRTRCTCKPDGMRCNNSSQCCNASCNTATRTCAPVNVIPTGMACSIEAGDVCADAAASCVAYVGPVLQGPAPTYCLLGYGEVCTEAGQCVTDSCAPIGGVGQPAATFCCGTDDIPCTGDGDCCLGYVCDGTDGVCKQGLG